MKSLIICLLITCGTFATFPANAQQSVTTTGSNASGSNGTVSFTVGQLITIMPTGTNGSSSHGVQQPYEISVITGIEEAGINLFMKVYPNPATDRLTLETEGREAGVLTCELLDINGRLLLKKSIVGTETTISMAGLQPAVYFLLISEKNRLIKVFRIIKQ